MMSEGWAPQIISESDRITHTMSFCPDLFSVVYSLL